MEMNVGRLTRSSDDKILRLLEWVNFNLARYLMVLVQYSVNGKLQHTHCRFVHGYGISFKVYFEGELDDTKLGLGFWWNEKSKNFN